MPKYTASIRHCSPPREGEQATSIGTLSAENSAEAHKMVQAKLYQEAALRTYVGDVARGGGTWHGLQGTVELRLAS